MTQATLEPTGWETLSCSHDGGPLANASIGLIALSNDLTSEGEMHRYLQSEGISVYTTRIAMSREASVAGLAKMEAQIADCARLLLPDDRLDVLAYACTSGAIEIGEAQVAELVESVRPGLPTTTPITAVGAALGVLEARRIAVLTPYPDDINRELEGYLRAKGFELLALGTYRQRGDPEICRVSPDSIRDSAIELGRRVQPDAVFISCTSLRGRGILEKAEAALDCPVVTSNQALAWHSLCLAGVEPASCAGGVGRLFRMPAPAA